MRGVPRQRNPMLRDPEAEPYLFPLSEVQRARGEGKGAP
jgi:hypothetical protein